MPFAKCSKGMLFRPGVMLPCIGIPPNIFGLERHVSRQKSLAWRVYLATGSRTGGWYGGKVSGRCDGGRVGEDCSCFTSEQPCAESPTSLFHLQSVQTQAGRIMHPAFFITTTIKNGNPVFATLAHLNLPPNPTM